MIVNLVAVIESLPDPCLIAQRSLQGSTLTHLLRQIGLIEENLRAQGTLYRRHFLHRGMQECPRCEQRIQAGSLIIYNPLLQETYRLTDMAFHVMKEHGSPWYHRNGSTIFHLRKVNEQELERVLTRR